MCFKPFVGYIYARGKENKQERKKHEKETHRQ
jgi:hypothetical protein